MQILITVNCQEQYESSDTDIYTLKNYYNPPPPPPPTHCVGAIKINRKEMLKQLKELQKAKVTVQHSPTNFSTSQIQEMF